MGAPEPGDTGAIPGSPTLADNQAESRFEARIDGDLAGWLEYIVKRGRIALIHTEVRPAHRGQGVAEALSRFGLDGARRRGLLVIASCPYVRAFVERHPETHDIVVGMAARHAGDAPVAEVGT